jgi:hypothetical protein
VSDGNGLPRYPTLRIKPGPDPFYQTEYRFSPMGSRRRIACPIGKGRGLPCLYLVERKPGPSSVIAITQGRLDGRVELQGFCGLTCAESGARQTPIRVENAPLGDGEHVLFLRVDRFVGWKCRCSNGRCRCMAKQSQPSGIGSFRQLGDFRTAIVAQPRIVSARAANVTRLGRWEGMLLQCVPITSAVLNGSSL